LKNTQKKILVLAPYPFGRVASQRFRFEQYWEVLNTKYQLSFHSFFNEKAFNLLYQEGHLFKKAVFVLLGFARRVGLLFSLKKFDTIFVHREIAPLGPPIFEWLICFVFQKRLIYDFDDAVWLSNTSTENKIVSLFKCHWKVKSICSWAWKVTCGNDFLVDYAKRHNGNVHFLPTTLNQDLIPTIQKPASDTFTIGWTGTHSTLKYLKSILPVLQTLEKHIVFDFLVIADKDPQLPLANYRFIKWRKETEWEDLALLDVGIMPLGNSEWEEGKCGFKALQYMSIGLPAIVSPTEANENIVEHGVTGFVCETEAEWLETLLLLTNARSTNERLGSEGRDKFLKEYSHRRWANFYATLFD
jgi:glycosyltransferase involved in cell wall biosynthesis